MDYIEHSIQSVQKILNGKQSKKVINQLRFLERKRERYKR